ncbi:DUF2782 domain-containing protein [Nitrosomonas halophila]|uniref:DUF2782 domain-containing protein n=1 Tax=Nitrosomonas halophila TaxID=44576 RepID=A0A1H3BH55_9PROT|nr:DUF2782 domain-containing protein [Nitrosomonas halophila]SDX41058.1 Protein of unknown function [Nitrosomonas halophila]HRQ04586.1 DUF2782 domain-containing protein [Nitrosomonas halophila]
MRSVTILLLLASSIWATSSVQAQPRPQPDDLVPLPELPDPPSEEEIPLPDLGLDPSLEPEITIREGEDETIEEYRINGHLYMIKITPRIGKPYYLLNRRGAVGGPHRGDIMDSDVSVPMWEIFRF